MPVDWDVDHVDLKWEPPFSDGGAPITGYIIEKKSKHAKEWTHATDVKEPVCKGTVNGLKENEEYQFRVRAVNKAGPGDPSEASERVIAKARFLRPRIDREAMKAITIRVGQSVEFHVPVAGEPPPEMVWTFKEQTLASSDKIKVKQHSLNLLHL